MIKMHTPKKTSRPTAGELGGDTFGWDPAKFD